MRDAASVQCYARIDENDSFPVVLPSLSPQNFHAVVVVWWTRFVFHFSISSPEASPVAKNKQAPYECRQTVRPPHHTP